MQDHHRILQLLARKIVGEVTSDELSELSNLLERYPDAIYYEEVLLQLWQKQPADYQDLDLVYDKFKEKFPNDFDPAGEDEPVRWFATTRIYIAAAALVLIIGIGFLFGYRRQEDTSQITATEIIAAKGIRKKVILPDGTQVWLNGNSKLTFNSNLTTSPNRVVNLEGEGYFDVTKDKHHPFIIHTSKFSIRVLGTAFNVKAYQDEKVAEASLIRGIIELTVADNQKQKILLKPNEKLTLTDKAIDNKNETNTSGQSEKRQLTIQNIRPVEIESQEYIEETSWVSDKLVFKNESFVELVPRLERWYNVKINIDNDAVNAYHFTGMLQNETIDQALKAMQLIRPFKFKIENDEININ